MSQRDPSCLSLLPASISEEEYWSVVADRLVGPEPYVDDGPDLDDPQLRQDPCTECGEVGACAYDSEGRALIHTTTQED